MGCVHPDGGDGALAPYTGHAVRSGSLNTDCAAAYQEQSAASEQNRVPMQNGTERKNGECCVSYKGHGCSLYRKARTSAEKRYQWQEFGYVGQLPRARRL